jgi:hypothetical protein
LALYRCCISGSKEEDDFRDGDIFLAQEAAQLFEEHHEILSLGPARPTLHDHCREFPIARSSNTDQGKRER